MASQKYIIYMDSVKPQSELKQVYKAFAEFINAKGVSAMILSDSYHIELLPERPQTGRAKRKNRNI